MLLDALGERVLLADGAMGTEIQQAGRETRGRSTGSTSAACATRIGRSHWEEPVDKHRVFGMSFASVYPHYVQKAEKKGRKKKEVDMVICWLTGYSPQALATQIKQRKDFETFFNEAPSLNPNADKITGLICGVRIQEIVDPLMRKIRYLDKLVDELAKGRPMEKILRK